MTRLLGRRVSVAMLNDFSAPSKKTMKFPAAWVPVFCQVIGNDEPQRYIIGAQLLKKVEFAEQRFTAESKRRQLHDELFRKS
jgi:hypothetical protein